MKVTTIFLIFFGLSCVVTSTEDDFQGTVKQRTIHFFMKFRKFFERHLGRLNYRVRILLIVNFTRNHSWSHKQKQKNSEFAAEGN